jgi:mRNA interferase RelE/StbE
MRTDIDSHRPITIVAMTTESLRTVRDYLSEFVDPAARRALEKALPEPVAAAVIGFLRARWYATRIKKASRFSSSWLESGRLVRHIPGALRTNGVTREVAVLRIEHRRDAYRSR